MSRVRSASLSEPQLAISSIVRWQPSQCPLASSTQMPTQGVRIGFGGGLFQENMLNLRNATMDGRLWISAITLIAKRSTGIRQQQQ
jgi:hypothetical protein